MSQKIFIIDTAVKTFKKAVFFDYTWYPSMKRVVNSDSTVTQLWNPITLRNPEDGGGIFSETSALARATQYNVSEDSSHRENIPEESVLLPYVYNGFVRIC
jgi:hypothetical protein